MPLPNNFHLHISFLDPDPRQYKHRSGSITLKKLISTNLCLGIVVAFEQNLRAMATEHFAIIAETR